MSKRFGLYKAFRCELDDIWIPELLTSSHVDIVDIKHNDEVVGIMVVEGNYIDCIYVEPKYRRLGLARKAVIDYFKHKRELPSLVIIKRNKEAKQFWKSLFEMKVVDGNFIETKYQVVAYKF